MIKRRLTFEDSASGRLDFRLVYEAIWTLDTEAIQKDDRRLIGEAQTALAQISEPIGPQPDEDIDVRLRKLVMSSSRTIEVSQRAFEKLTSLVEDFACHPVLFAHQQDLLERLSAAERVDADKPRSVWSKPGA